MSFRVTAVVVFDTQVVPIGGGSGSGNIEPTALVSSFPVPGAARTMSYGNEAEIRLRPGATIDSLSRAATALAKRYPDTSGQILTISQATQVAATQQAIRPQAIALAAFAALAGPDRARRHRPAAQPAARPGLGRVPRAARHRGDPRQPGRAVAGQARHRHRGRRRRRRRRRRRGVPADADRPGPAGRAAPGRRGQPRHPGAGFAAIALLPLALLAGAAWRAASAAGGPLGVAEPAQPARRSRIGGTLTRAGSVTGGVGVAMAFEPGHGRTAVPVRSALAGSVIAVAALDRSRRLRHQPRRPGLHAARLRAELGRPA